MKAKNLKEGGLSRRDVLHWGVRGAAAGYLACAAGPVFSPTRPNNQALPISGMKGQALAAHHDPKLDDIQKEIEIALKNSSDESGQIYRNALVDPGYSPDDDDAVGTTTISMCAMEAETGAILFAVNGDKPTSPASTIKTVHNLVIYDALEEGVIDLDEAVIIPESTAVPVKAENNPSGLLHYQSAKVRDLIMEIILKSNNQAAFALAVHTANAYRRQRGHSELSPEQNFDPLHGEFVAMMQSKVERMGLTDTMIRNCCGYYNPEQMTTASDLAEVARHLVAEEKYQKYAENYNNKPYSYTAFERSNGQWKPVARELHTHSRIPSDPDRIKTGYTRDSGGCVIKKAEREDGARLIIVVTGNKEVGPVLGSACKASMQLADIALPLHRGPQPVSFPDAHNVSENTETVMQRSPSGGRLRRGRGSSSNLQADYLDPGQLL